MFLLQAATKPTAALHCVQYVMCLFRLYSPPLYHMMKPWPCSNLLVLGCFCDREGMHLHMVLCTAEPVSAPYEVDMQGLCTQEATLRIWADAMAWVTALGDSCRCC